MSCFAHTAALPVLDFQYLSRGTRSSPVLHLLTYLLVKALLLEPYYIYKANIYNIYILALLLKASLVD